MHLHIDTSSRKNSFVELDGQRVSATDGVLPAIQKALAKRLPNNITSITTNPGPGSFTGLKVGAAVANALGYALGIIKVEDQFIPEYGKDPNISQIKSLPGCKS